jgi:hypothetical protein
MGILSLVKKIWGERLVRYSLIVGAVVSGFSLLAAAVNGLETTAAFFAWAQWIYERANTPWLGVFVVIAISFTLHHGLKKVAAAERVEGETTRQKLANETETVRALEARVAAARAEDLKLPMMMVQIAAFSHDIQNFRIFISNLRGRIGDCQRRVARLRNEQIPINSTLNMGFHLPNYDGLNGYSGTHITLELDGKLRPLPNINTPQIVANVFNASEQPSFIQALTENQRIAEEWVNQCENVLRDKEGEIRREIDNLGKAVVEHG